MRETTQKPNRGPSIAESNFPAVTGLPDGNPQVIVAFHGLMAIRFKSPGYCEVAIHNDAPRHNFSIKAYDLTSGSEEPFYSYNFGPAGSSSIDVIRVDAQSADPSQIGFFQPVNFTPGTANEGRIVEDLLDFRLVNDFESQEFYGRDLHKKEEKFRPRIILKSGIFVTLIPSDFKFKRQAPFDELRLGKIAEMVAAAFYLKSDGLVALRFAQEELRLPLKPHGETLYLVLFDNSCSQEVCKFKPDSPIKEERNDFFEYYKMFDVPEDAEEFELILEDSHKNSKSREAATGPEVQAFARAAAFLRKLTAKTSSNDAPCGPGAFGGGGGRL